MVYIKNNKKYSVTFTAVIEGKKKVFTFPCFLQYKDTGNIVNTGVTDLTDSEYDTLIKTVKQFADLLKKGVLVKTAKTGATQVADKVNALSKENEELKKQLAQKNEQLVKPVSSSTEEQVKELADLKSQLEALKKKDIHSTNVDKKAKAVTKKVSSSEDF